MMSGTSCQARRKDAWWPEAVNEMRKTKPRWLVVTGTQENYRKTIGNGGLPIYNLVGGLEHDFHYPEILGNVIIPIAFIFFRGIGQPPTS